MNPFHGICHRHKMPDLSVGRHELQKLWIRDRPESRAGGRWLVIIHGGLWRDPRVTRRNAHHMMETLGSFPPFHGAASLDYRISPEVKHPEHYNDVADQMRYLTAVYKPEHIVLIGHSAGAFLAAQIAQNFEPIELCIGIEGIYDLHSFVEELPDYKPAIDDAFGTDTAHWPRLKKSRAGSSYILIQSSEDEHLSFRQTESFAKQTGATTIFLTHGRHDEVFETMDLRNHLLNYL